MITPDGQDTRHDGMGMAKAILLGVTVVLIVVGFMALGWLSAPDQAVDADIGAPVDDDFSVAQIEQGDRLRDTSTTTFATGIPLALTSHDGELYLFAAGTTKADPSGMMAWRSTDGLSWDELGPVMGDEYLVSTVASTPEGLVAAGRREGDTSLIVWTSPDGLDWKAVESPPVSDDGSLYPDPIAVQATGESLVVAGQVAPDRERILEEYLRDAGMAVDLSTVTWDTRRTAEGDSVLQAYGPLGTPALTTTLEELDLTAEEQDLVVSSYDTGPDTDVWTYREGVGWETGAIDAAPLHGMLTGSDGTLVAVAGESVHTSVDGLHWQQRTTVGASIEATRRWGDGLAAVTDGIPLEVLTSPDGLAWDRTGAAAGLPTALGWRPTSVGAGPEGVVTAVEARTGVFIRPIEPATLTASNGATLTLNFARGVVRLGMDDGEQTWIWDRGDSISDPEGIVADLDEEIVSLLDPDSSDMLASFTFEELARAKNEYNTARFEPIGHQALILSGDGRDWTVQDIADEIGNDSRIQHLEVVDDRVVAIARHGREPFTPYPVPGFAIWTGEIP